MDMSQYFDIFIEETREHLQSLNNSLLELEKDMDRLEDINEIFRVAHTLKGMSGTMGFRKMAKLTHEMESLLHCVRSKEVKLNADIIDALFKCLDALESYLESIVDCGNEGENKFTELVSQLAEFVGGESDSEETAVKEQPIQTPQSSKDVESKSSKGEEINDGPKEIKLDEYELTVVQKAKELGQFPFCLTVVLNPGCVLKSARAFILFQAIEKHAEVIKAVPIVQDIEDEKFDLEISLVIISQVEKEVLLKDISKISEIDKIVLEEVDVEKFLEAQKSSEVENSVSIQDLSQNLSDIENRVNEQVNTESDNNVQLTNTLEVKNAVNKDIEKVEVKNSSKQKAGKTVRVDIDRLDVLMNLVSELIIIKTRLKGISDVESTQAYNEAVEYLERITTSLHDAVMKVRMVPVEMVFNRFPRMVRDVAKELKKEISLTMSGEETELDRTVIDEIGEPLIHLLRNSADHGLESTVDRVRAGKSEVGSIYLRAYQDGNNVVIEVEDDGGGIDLERVKNRAISQGIISSESAVTVSKKEIIDFLFKPSFSTAEVVTGLSGRGVGLDVVKIKIESLGGVVEVETERGEGSKFIIRLPLTLAIIQALLVFVGDEKFAIPLNSIKEIIKIKKADLRQVQHQEVILLRNIIVPIVNLGEILGVEKDGEEEDESKTVVIIKKGDKLVGFVVDELVGQKEIVIKSLGKLLEGIKIIAGATILGDGNVALIVDVNSLV